MSDFTFRTTSDLLEVPANGRIEIQIKTLKKLNELQLDFKVMNAFIEPKIHPIMKISVKI